MDYSVDLDTESFMDNEYFCLTICTSLYLYIYAYLFSSYICLYLCIYVYIHSYDMIAFLHYMYYIFTYNTFISKLFSRKYFYEWTHKNIFII